MSGFNPTPVDTSSPTPLPMPTAVAPNDKQPYVVRGGPVHAADTQGNQLIDVSMYVYDGNNIVEGATTDAAVTGDNAGSLSAKLRGLSKIWNDVWDSVNHLFHIDLKQVGGAALSVSNPIITQQQIAAAVLAGKVFTVSTGAQSTAAQTSALCVFNAATTKNIIVISALTAKGNDNANFVESLNLVTTNPAYSNSVTPVNNLGGSSATSGATVTWQANASVVGSAVAHSNTGQASVLEMLNNGRVVVLPSGVSSGATFFVPQSATGGTFAIDMTYIEY